MDKDNDETFLCSPYEDREIIAIEVDKADFSADGVDGN